MSSFFRNAKNFFRQTDIKLFIVAFIASVMGMTLIYTATKNLGGSFLVVQLGATILGICLYFLISWLDVDSVSSWWKYVYIANILLICSLIVFGTGAEETGNRAWIRFGPIGIQPAEFGKILFILAFAGHINTLHDRIEAPSTVLILTLHALIPICLLYVISSDLGSVLVYLIIFISMMFCAGIKLRWFAAAFLTLGAVSPLVWNFFLREDQTQGGYLPARQTDFIFSVAGEEFGLIGCLIVMAILSVIVARCISMVMRSSTLPSALVCCGVSAMLLFQIIENIGMCTGLMPVIGLTLPLFSYGGSSVLAVYMALGLISSARMRAVPSRLSN